MEPSRKSQCVKGSKRGPSWYWRAHGASGLLQTKKLHKTKSQCFWVTIKFFFGKNSEFIQTLHKQKVLWIGGLETSNPAKFQPFHFVKDKQKPEVHRFCSLPWKSLSKSNIHWMNQLFIPYFFLSRSSESNVQDFASFSSTQTSDQIGFSCSHSQPF